MKQAGEVVGELANAAQDVKNAARRFGFNRKKNVHPADSLDDARIAAVGVVLAVAASDGELTAGELDATKLEAAKTFNIDATEAGEMVALARWTVSQCGNTDNAIYRLPAAPVRWPGWRRSPIWSAWPAPSPPSIPARWTSGPRMLSPISGGISGREGRRSG